MRLAPSATSSSSVVDSSASTTSSTCTLSIGVPSLPAFHRQRFSDWFKEEGTSRPGSDGASTSSGYNSRSRLELLPAPEGSLRSFTAGVERRAHRPRSWKRPSAEPAFCAPATMTSDLLNWTRSDDSDFQLSRGEPYLTEAGIFEPFAGIQAADLQLSCVV